MAGGEGPYDPAELARALREVPGLLFEEVTTRFESYFRDFSGQMNRDARARLNTRSGALANSFRPFAVGSNPRSWRGGVYTDSPYGAKQEFGGETTPTRKRYLAIPLDAAMTGAGVTRGDPGLWGRDRTFVSESRDGRVFVFLKTGRKRPRGWKKGDDDPSIVPLFRLKKRVTMQGRLGFFRSWDADDQTRSKILGEAAVAALRRADG